MQAAAQAGKGERSLESGRAPKTLNAVAHASILSNTLFHWGFKFLVLVLFFGFLRNYPVNKKNGEIYLHHMKKIKKVLCRRRLRRARARATAKAAADPWPRA